MSDIEHDTVVDVAVVPRATQAMSASPTPAAMIHHAIEKGASIEQLDKLLDLQVRFEAMEAKKAYTDAMANFKLNPPRIEKDKQVRYGNTSYRHASLGNVCEKINSSLAGHGLSAGWDVDQAKDWIHVTCKLTHRLGHAEAVTMSGPADTSGQKNPVQMIASTVSYLQRYTLLAITGMATHDDGDDDGRGGADRLKQSMAPPAPREERHDAPPAAKPAASSALATDRMVDRIKEAGLWYKSRGDTGAVSLCRKALKSRSTLSMGAAGLLIAEYKKALAATAGEADENANQDVDPETGEVREIDVPI